MATLVSSLTIDVLKQLWPNGNSKVPGLLEAMAAQAPDVFSRYGLNDDTTIAHAMAQFSVECGAGVEMVENLNYSAQGLLATWPKHFNADTAASCARQPEKIAIIAYGGRNGNDPAPSEDSWNFRGRGLSQLTGKANYQALSKTINDNNPDNPPIDLVANPDTVLDPNFALECAVADFCMCGCLPCAIADNVHDVTEALNGGLIGYPDREAWLTKWKNALGVASLAV